MRTTLLLSAALLIVTTLPNSAQAPDDTRQIVAEEFVKARPATKSAKPARPAPRYTLKKPAASTAPAKGAAAVGELGVTVWRLRPAATGDQGTRLLVQDDGGAGWVPERVDAGQELALGDRVRLSFETPVSGYLYVVDREEYSDGTHSAAYLIFPTDRPTGARNVLKGGRLIEIPARDDRPNHFTVRQSRADQVAEVLTAIVSDKPISELPLAAKPTRLPDGLLDRWSAEWAGPTEELVRSGESERGWSASEERAGAEATRLLTQDDPPPQTIYRVRLQPGRPMLVHIRLPYGASSPRP
jgi:hypothetical protein